MRSSEFAYKIPEKMYRKFREQSRQLLESIVQFIEPEIGETIVDVGTGAGFLALGLAEKVGENGKVIGLDISRSAIQRARRMAAKKNQSQILEFKVGDVYAIPLEDDFADAVCCKSLICPLSRRQKAINEMARIVKHGGKVIAAEPGELVGLPSQIKKAFYKAAHTVPLNEYSLRNLFQRAGLRSIEIAIREPPIVTDAAVFEWATKNLFGDRPLWELARQGGADEDKVRLVHKELVSQIKTIGLKFGTGAIFCKGVKP
jgi:ubiquinone/menaquinone biosynthesis C-methylase UbiE